MNLTVYVPKDMEEELRKRAERSGTTVPRFVQAVLREALSVQPDRFPESFARLAGSWEDTRTAKEIVADIRGSRAKAARAALR
jgi:hypothetical protein